jgi:hypothetical protein
LNPSLTEAIEHSLQRSRRCEAQVARDAALNSRIKALRGWQAQRLAMTYADLRRDPRYRPAVEFFLQELYGPQDFGARERAFERAWRRLRRTLPPMLLEVLAAVAELQALTAELDLAVALRLPVTQITAARYLAAYRAAGNADQRTRQIDLILEIGRHLVDAVALPWVDWALRAAHWPAHALGFAPLQRFLEHGYAAFRALGDANTFLAAIAERERCLMQALLQGPEAAAFALLDSEGDPAIAVGRRS